MKAGDRVRFLNEVGEGVIVRLAGKEALVRDEYGFEHWYPLTELLRNKKELNIHHNPVVEDKVEEKQISQKHNNNHKSKLVVDLHIHELIDNSTGLTNHEMVSIQLNKAKQTINEARKKKVRYVELIHGKGKGKLRTEIAYLLKSLKVKSFYDAEYDINGSGATIVELY